MISSVFIDLRPHRIGRSVGVLETYLHSKPIDGGHLEIHTVGCWCKGGVRPALAMQKQLKLNMAPEHIAALDSRST